jgi:septal ring factor EnvC (AmiA/AmiB activator)
VDPATVTMLGGVSIALISSIGSPMLLAKIKRREEENPTKGWQAAISFMQKRVDEMSAEIHTLKKQIEVLEDDLSSKIAVIARQEQTISEQGRAIVARDRRIMQLEVAWPTDRTIPPPDPGYVRLLRQHYGGDRDDRP